MNENERENLTLEWLEHDITILRRKEIEREVEKYRAILTAACTETTDPAVASAFSSLRANETALAMFGRK